MNQYTPTQLLEMISSLAAVMSVILFTIAKYIAPWVWKQITGKAETGESDNLTGIREELAALEAHQLKLETNHMAHFRADLDSFTKSFNDYIIRTESSNQAFRETVLQRLAVVETALNIKK